jgi:hypothetical protein
MGYWRFETRFGRFAIAHVQGRWHAVWENESLGSYHSPEAALDDLVGGHTFTPSSGIDTSECGLPEELSEWEFVRPAR